MTLNVGTICYSTQSGLGRLAKSFFDAGVVNRVLLHPHPRYVPHDDWYPADRRFSPDQSDYFLDGLDCLLLFESCFDLKHVVRAAKRLGIRVVLMPMYEFTPWPFDQHVRCEIDLYLCPSLLDLEYYRRLPDGDSKAVFLPAPVDVPWRLRERAEVFVHNAGHGGKGFRNGTPQLLEAMQFVNSPDVRLIVRGQPHERRIERLFREYGRRRDPRVELRLEDVPDGELWGTGDVFIFPERFNGLSLPMQEAFASGLLVIGTNRFPMNTWLPPEPLINPTGFDRHRIAVEFDRAIVDPRDIAAAIDFWHGTDISYFSRMGREWAERHSWEVLRPRYLELLAG